MIMLRECPVFDQYIHYNLIFILVDKSCVEYVYLFINCKMYRSTISASLRSPKSSKKHQIKSFISLGRNKVLSINQSIKVHSSVIQFVTFLLRFTLTAFKYFLSFPSSLSFCQILSFYLLDVSDYFNTNLFQRPICCFHIFLNGNCQA